MRAMRVEIVGNEVVLIFESSEDLEKVM